MRSGVVRQKSEKELSKSSKKKELYSGLLNCLELDVSPGDLLFVREVGGEVIERICEKIEEFSVTEKALEENKSRLEDELAEARGLSNSGVTRMLEDKLRDIKQSLSELDKEKYMFFSRTKQQELINSVVHKIKEKASQPLPTDRIKGGDERETRKFFLEGCKGFEQ